MLLRLTMVLYLNPWDMSFRKEIELAPRSSPYEHLPIRLVVNALSLTVNMNLEVGFVEVLFSLAICSFPHANACSNIGIIVSHIPHNVRVRACLFL